jgi:hypothetical protein
MKILNHPATLALGTATLYLLVLIGPLVSPFHNAIYHYDGSPIILFLVPLINLTVLWLILSYLFRLAERPSSLRFFIWVFIVFTFPWVLLKDCVFLGGWALPRWISITTLFGPFILFFAILIFRKTFALAWFEHLRSFVTTLLGFAALSGLILVGQLLWFGWRARHLNRLRPLHQQTATLSQRPKARVIWILLDELSYQQVYERRYAGLFLPAFDQLAAHSSVFTHVVPAGIYTERVIPSLMTGEAVDRIQASSDGQLLMHNANSRIWQSFDPHQTIFQDALDEGYRTAIAGWYNPYCRMLAPVLDRCFWTSHFSEQIAVDDQPLITNLLYPLHYILSLANSLFFHQRHISVIQSRYSELHIDDYKELNIASNAFLANSSNSFVFLHLPIPHPEGIYDRKAGRLTTGKSSYIDNLALADQYLGHVQSVLEQQGEWDSSAIVIMGDHSWRTKLFWAGLPAWTEEEREASHGGQFDDRPAYIVKMPYQQQPVRIDERFAAVRTRALLDGILDKKLQSPDDLVKWVHQQPEAQVNSH